jgi:hypothetical protein
MSWLQSERRDVKQDRRLSILWPLVVDRVPAGCREGSRDTTRGWMLCDDVEVWSLDRLVIRLPHNSSE